MKIQEIEDYLINNDASVTVQSYLGDDGIEYEAFIEVGEVGEAVNEIARAYSLLSFEDALEQLAGNLTKQIVPTHSAR